MAIWGVDWEAIEVDVDTDGYVEPLNTGIETRYARLEDAHANDVFVSFVADPGGDGLVEVRVPWATLEAIMAGRKV